MFKQGITVTIITHFTLSSSTFSLCTHKTTMSGKASKLLSLGSLATAHENMAKLAIRLLTPKARP
jgi:hypothetical protein